MPGGINTSQQQDKSTGRFLPVHNTDKRNEVIQAIPDQVMAGMTLDQIAAHHNVPKSTLCLWLHHMGDEYKELRNTWLDLMLIKSTEAIDSAKDPLELARGREQFRYATWYAERRDPNRYGQVAQPQTAQIVINMAPVRERSPLEIEDAQEIPVDK